METDQPKPTGAQERAEQAALRGRADNIPASERSKRDQPKPTGESQLRNCGTMATKSTIVPQSFTGIKTSEEPPGEWTVDMVALMVAKGGVDMIVAAHNAALESAKRECAKEIAAERDQLEAWQERTAKSEQEYMSTMQVLDECSRDNAKLREKLAHAEREKVAKLEDTLAELQGPDAQSQR